MDKTSLALVAAGLPALIAALTFTGGTIFGVVSKTRQARVDAVMKLFDALDGVPAKAAAPRIASLWLRPELTASTAANRLMIVLPKRDQILWEWARYRITEMVDRTGLVEVEASAAIQGLLSIWLVDRRRARRLIVGDLKARNDARATPGNSEPSL